MLLNYLQELLEQDLPLARQLAILEQTLASPFSGEDLFLAVEYLYQLAGVRAKTFQALDIVGTGGDGRGLFNISTTSSFVIAAMGIPVLKHGNTSVSSRSGSIDCLKALGVHLPETLAAAEVQLHDQGLSFLFAPQFYPILLKVKAARKALAEQGKRSIFNVLGPLLNPLRPTHQLIGVAEPQLILPIAEALYLLKRQGFVFSCAGTDEIVPGDLMHIVKVDGTGVKTFDFDYKTEQLALIHLADLVGGDATDNADTLRQLLMAQLSGPKLEVVLINAAFAGMLYDELSFQEAYQTALNAIHQGQAYLKLQGLCS